LAYNFDGMIESAFIESLRLKTVHFKEEQEWRVFLAKRAYKNGDWVYNKQEPLTGPELFDKTLDFLNDRIDFRCNTDDLIPFCEYFIVPYVLWYGYVAVVMIYMMLKDKSDFKKMCVFLYVGMTIFLIISTLYPNGHLLRPDNYERDNIFTHLCAILHRVDTATNIFPSIHVYDSIGVHLAIVYNEKMKKNKWLCIASTILMVSIVLSTVFLKQHSVWDVIGAAVLAFIMQQIVYVRPWKRITQRKRTKVKSIKC
jgi:membrane-associated phospholipid phosphatase